MVHGGIEGLAYNCGSSGLCLPANLIVLAVIVPVISYN